MWGILFIVYCCGRSPLGCGQERYEKSSWEAIRHNPGSRTLPQSVLQLLHLVLCLTSWIMDSKGDCNRNESPPEAAFGHRVFYHTNTTPNYKKAPDFSDTCMPVWSNSEIESHLFPSRQGNAEAPKNCYAEQVTARAWEEAERGEEHWAWGGVVAPCRADNEDGDLSTDAFWRWIYFYRNH